MTFPENFPEKLDLIFPFVVLAYGALVTIVTETTSFMRIAEERFPVEVTSRLTASRNLARICVVIGFFWSIQTLFCG